jgi:hypothetical protein
MEESSKTDQKFSWIRWGFGIAAILAALHIGVIVWLQTESGLQTIRRLIIRTIEHNIDATCRIAEIRGTPMGNLEFIGVELHSGTTESTLLAMDRMDVSFRLFPLLSGKIWISDMEISGLRINLEKIHENKWNIETLVSPDHGFSKYGTGFFTVDIRQMVITDAAGTLTRRNNGREEVRHTMSLACRASVTVGREAAVRLSHLALAVDDPHIVVTDGDGQLRYDPDTGRLDFLNLRLAGEESRITIDGALTMFEKPLSMDMRLMAEALSLPEVGRAAQLEFVDAGMVAGEFHFAGTMEDLDWRAALELGKSRVQGEGTVGLGDRPHVSMDVSGRLADVDPAVVPMPVFQRLIGNLNAEVRVAGRYEGESGFVGSAAVDLEPSRIAGYDITAASLQAAVQGPDISLEIHRLETPYGRGMGRAVVQGIISRDPAAQIDLSITVHDVNPALLFFGDDVESALGFSLQAEFVLPVDLGIAGTDGYLQARMLPSSVMDFNIVGGELEAAWSGDQVRVDKFSVLGDIGEITASGVGSWRSLHYQGVVSATIQDLGAAAPMMQKYFQAADLTGSAAVEAGFSGIADVWDVEAEILTTDFVVNDISAKKLHMECHWRGGKRDFTLSADAVGEELRYTDIRISGLNVSSAWSPDAVDVDLTMNAASGEKLTASGGVYDWTGPVRKIRLDHMAFTSDAFPALASQSPSQILVTGDSVFIESVRLVSREASFQAGGAFGLSRSGSVSAEMSLENLDLQMIRGFVEGGEALDGFLTAQMTLAGFVDDPEIIFSASLLEGMYKELALSELHIQSTYRDERAEAEASFFGSEGKLADLRGAMSCRLALYPWVFSFEPETLALTMAAEDLSIADLAPYWPPADAMGGRISGYVNIFGDADGPVMDASLAGSELVYRDFKLSDIEVSAAYQADTLQILAAGFRDDLKVLDVSGAVPVRLSLLPARVEPGPDSMRVSVHVHDFDISNIDGLTRHSEYAVTGKAELIAEVGGSINDPLVMGRLSLREGSLYLRQQRLTYQSLEADLEFDSDRIAITEIRAVEDDKGVLSLTGIVHHDRFRPGDFDIRAVGSDIRVPFYPGLTGRMSPDLRLQGTLDAPVVSGDIRIPRGQVNLDVLFSQQPSEIKIIEPVAHDNGVFTLPDQPPPALAFLDPLRADITITVPGNVWLRGEDESIEIRGKVNVEKEPGRSFVVHGPLSAVRGTYRFRGKLFKITSGELNFIGQDVIDPPLSIQAETRIGDVRIIIYLTGTYERLNMRFDSDPPMDEVDIISYLIFGRPQTSLTEGESFRAAEAALAITGQIAADELREILGDRFRIDYIDISAGSGGFQHGSLSMGKYVTPRVFVIYRHTFATEDPQQVEVYYEINRHFSLETQVNDEKTLAVDLIWKYEF